VGVGYNWENSLADYASRSGILGGFSISFITIIVSGQVGNQALIGGVTWGNFAVFVMGLSALLFISAMDFLLQAKDSDIWGLSEANRNYLKSKFNPDDWQKLWKNNLRECERQESRGRHAYNFAILLLFGGLFLILGPYNFVVAVILLLAGVVQSFFTGLFPWRF
jgi:Flp pilus assembly protein TadB